METRTVGDVTIIALIDTIQTYPAAAVYPEAGEEALRRFTAYFDANGGVALNFAAFVVIDGDSRLLVDTGWGPEYRGRLPEELSAAGLTPADITAVTFTHLHGDHTGWNIDRATGRPLFPNARYYVPRGDYDHYRAQPSSVEGGFGRDILAIPEAQMELIEGEQSLGRSVTTLPTPGHTPGHTSFLVASKGERGCVLGDVTISLADVELPSLKTSFDWDHAIARGTREAMLRRLAGDGSLVAASHLPVPGFGRFTAQPVGHRWLPA